MAAADTVYVQPNTETRLHSETADNILWEKYAGGGTFKHAHDVATALARITFKTETDARPLHKVVELVSAEASKVKSGSGNDKAVIVVLGRSRRMAVDTHKAELQELEQDQLNERLAGAERAPTTSLPNAPVRESRKSSVQSTLSHLSPVFERAADFCFS